MNSNPRKIKRITNIYRCARLLAISSETTSYLKPEKGEQHNAAAFRRKLLVWIVLLEQWPVRMSWILQVLEDDEQSDRFLANSNPRLHDLYCKYAESRVYNLHLSGCPKSLAESYQKIYILDGDPELFDQLIRKSNLSVKDVGGFSQRSEHHLISYTINLNPAIRCLLATIASHREDIHALTINAQSKFHSRSIKILEEGMYNWNKDKLKKWFEGLEITIPAAVYQRIDELHIDGSTMHRIVGDGKHHMPDFEALKDLGISSKLLQQKVIALWMATKQNMHNNQNTTAVSKAQKQKEQPEKAIEQQQEIRPISTALGDPLRVVNPIQETGTNDFMAEPILELGESLLAQKRTTDDKSGRDHIGYINYAVALAILIHLGVSTPVIFGLYATWGTGKSFIMNKTIAATKLLWLHSRIKSFIKDNAQLKKYESALEKLLNEDEEMVHTFYKWYILQCPPDCYDPKSKSLEPKEVDQKWSKRNEPFFWQEEILIFLTSIVSTCCRKVGWVLCRQKSQLQKLVEDDGLCGVLFNTFQHQKAIAKTSNNLAIDVENIEDDGEAFDYEFIWWNAWLYSGADNLWAGLIKELHSATEFHFGKEYSNAQLKAKIYSIAIQSIIGLILLLITIYLGTSSLVTQAKSLFSIGLTVLAVIGTMLSTAQVFLTSYFAPAKASDKIVEEVASANFQQKLGFMSMIKDQLGYVGRLLQSSNLQEETPNVWDYLLPDWLGSFKSPIRSICTMLWGGAVLPNCAQSKPCKLIIFIDDLDRCPPEKAVEVLQSLVLLTEETPFAIILAIDPRIIVTAVESVHSKFFSQCGISGYEYLDKIVHIPFAIPPLVNSEKANLCEGYLTGDSKQEDKLSAADLLAKKVCVEQYGFPSNHLALLREYYSKHDNKSAENSKLKATTWTMEKDCWENRINEWVELEKNNKRIGGWIRSFEALVCTDASEQRYLRAKPKETLILRIFYSCENIENSWIQQLQLTIDLQKPVINIQQVCGSQERNKELTFNLTVPSEEGLYMIWWKDDLQYSLEDAARNFPSNYDNCETFYGKFIAWVRVDSFAIETAKGSPALFLPKDYINVDNRANDLFGSHGGGGGGDY